MVNGRDGGVGVLYTRIVELDDKSFDVIIMVKDYGKQTT